MKQIPITLYVNLFTLKDKNPKENKYIDIFYVWLAYLIKYGQLNQLDTLVLQIDTETLNYLKNSYIFKSLIHIRNNLFKFNIITYEPPSTVKNGMMMRYHVNTLPNIDKQQIFIHLDIDVIITNNIRKLIEKQDLINTNKESIFYVKEEGPMLKGNYYGDIITDEEKNYLYKNNLENIFGYTSGIFAWLNQPSSNHCLDIFNLVIEKDKEVKVELYQHEQPFFNYAIFQNLFKETSIKIKTMPLDYINHNIPFTKKNKDTLLVNYCGIAGDDGFHWDKILQQLLFNFLDI